MSSSVATTVGVVLTVAVIASAALVIYRRYCFNVKWRARNIWSVCEEWRQRLSWLWAPREEKVGLVKAQHPTAQTIPGLYRHSGNNSQHLLHSDSDLRLDAQGAFTRFESVDRDLHPPMGVSGNAIPPQPLRPAPQPRPATRPRPSPLQTPHAAEYLRQELGPTPLTPPPIPRLAAPHHGGGKSVFVFQKGPPQSYNYGQHGGPCNEQIPLHFDMYSTKAISEGIQASAFTINNSADVNGLEFKPKYENLENTEEEIKDAQLNRIFREIPYRSYHFMDDSSEPKYDISTSQINEKNVLKSSDDIRSVSSYPEYDKSASTNYQYHLNLMRNNSRGSYSSTNFINSNNSLNQNVSESFYGPQAVTESIHNSQIYNNDLKTKDEQAQVEEMTPFNNTDTSPETFRNEIHANSKNQGLQRVCQYIQSLPDVPIYELMNDQVVEDQISHDDSFSSKNNELASSPVPPPAPQDPSNSVEVNRKNGLTTGEKIFSALRSVTSQSYIDASEFYNSVLSSAQQVPMLTFPMIRRSSLQLEKDRPANSLQDEASNLFIEPGAIDIDGSRRASDLYNPELNFKAHQTAQEVYNSLQDPPASPLYLKDLSPKSYPYMSDPSFTRTSEDIFNSLELRRKSLERLNGLHEYIEADTIDLIRKRSSQDICNALEEFQLKRRLSQQFLDDSHGYSNFDMEEITPGSRRNSQGPEPEPPPDEINLKRAVSFESVCSDTSVVLGDIEEITVVGHICVGLEHERWGGRGADIEGDLAVSVLEARDLIAPDGRPAQDTLARVYLLPDKQTHVQTRLYRGSPSPSYQEKFLFPLDGGPLGRTLLVEIFSVELNMGGEAYLLGQASLKLGPAARPPATTWLPLITSNLPVPHLGEIMFSLNYLPTAERLTLVVVKARNLQGTNEAAGEFFVKVYLLQQGKKIQKKKTSVKRGEKSPTFNEAMIFNVPVHILQTIQLRLTVAELNSDFATNAKAYSVGHVIIGANATGKSLTHWRQMLSVLRRPVAMWHPLRIS